MELPVRRALQGVLFALGAPAGWLAIRVLSGRSIPDELASHMGLYLYLLVPTSIAFATFGALLGVQEVRLSAAMDHLKAEALTDELTDLKNLRYFRTRLEEELAAYRRTRSPLAVAMIDLDHFKRVNDQYGHPEGDRLLKAVARAISSVARHGETAARVGGEEFALLLPGADGEQAVAASERVRRAVAALRLRQETGPAICITVSVGCASTADLGQLSPDELYSAADEALYTAKREGRDRTVRARAEVSESSA